MTLLLSRPELDRLFPAHLVLDRGGHIRRMGRALYRRLGDANLGADILSIAKFVRPKSVLSFEQLRQTRGALIITIAKADNFRLKGVVLNSGDQTFLLLSPAIDGQPSGAPSGLRFDDFSEIDSALDVVLTSEMQRNSLREAEELIAELRTARAAAEAADQAKTKFLADVSHEIRNPLNGILGMAELIAASESLPATVKSNIDVIRAAGRTLDVLLSDLLDLASANEGKLRILAAPFHVETEIRAAVAIMERQAQAKGLNFVVNFAASNFAWAVGDATRLRQIVANLAGNAVKFTEAGVVSVHVLQARQSLVVEVSDSGPGIDAEVRSELFSRFRQANVQIAQRYGGTGLGLAICRELAVAMRGEISVDAAVGGGARFRLELPFECFVEGEDAHSSHVENNREYLYLGDALPLLIVDDQDHNREVARQMLAGVCANITLATSGEMALEAWQSTEFGLILMDLRMLGIDGLETTQRIRALEAKLGRRRTPIVILSADNSDADRRRSLAAGADEHCAKPMLPDKLIETVKQHIVRMG